MDVSSDLILNLSLNHQLKFKHYEQCKIIYHQLLTVQQWILYDLIGCQFKLQRREDIK